MRHAADEDLAYCESCHLALPADNPQCYPPLRLYRVDWETAMALGSTPPLWGEWAEQGEE